MLPTRQPFSFAYRDVAQQRDTSDDTRQEVTNDDAGSELRTQLLTCRFWLGGGCRYGDNCGLEHRQTGKIAEERLITCPHWAIRDRCYEGDNCPYAHYVTPYIAGIRQGPVRRYNQAEVADDQGNAQVSAQQDSLLAGQPDETPRAQPDTTLMKHEQACRYWYNDFCKRGTTCDYAHSMRNFMKNRGGPPTSTAGMLIRLPDGTWSNEHMPPLPGPSHAGGQPAEQHEIADRRSRSPSPVRSPSKRRDNAANVFAIGYTPSGGPPTANRLGRTAGSSQSTIPVTLEIVFLDGASETVEISVALTGLSDAARRVLWQSGIHGSVVKAEHAGLNENVKDYFRTRETSSLGSGEDTAGIDAAFAFHNLVQNIKARSEALFIFHSDISLVLYVPGQQADLTKAFDALAVARKDAEMLFELLPKPDHTEDQNLTTTLGEPREALSSISTTEHSLNDLGIEELFSWFSGPVQRRVMILFSQEHADEEDNMASYLRARDVLVHAASTDGSWLQFCNDAKSGVVVVRFSPKEDRDCADQGLGTFLLYTLPQAASTRRPPIPEDQLLPLRARINANPSPPPVHPEPSAEERARPSLPSRSRCPNPRQLLPKLRA